MATPHEHRTHVKPAEREKRPRHRSEQKREKEMSQVQESYMQAEQKYGSDLPNRAMANGFHVIPPLVSS